MRAPGRAALVIAVSIVAVTICVGVASFQIHRCPRLPQRIFTRNYTPGSSLQFRWLGSTSGKGEASSDYDGNQYLCSDCVEVDSDFETFASVSDARRAMYERIRGAAQVLAHVTKSDERGETERSVLAVKTIPEFLVLRRRGNRIHLIWSRSLNHALEFERRLLPSESSQ
jgi:hypothetical protein